MNRHGDYTPEYLSFLADNSLDVIVEIKKDLLEFFNKTRNNIKKVNGLGVIEWSEYSALIEEQLDDMLHKSWHRNMETSGRIDYPTDVPSIHEVGKL